VHEGPATEDGGSGPLGLRVARVWVMGLRGLARKHMSRRESAFKPSDFGFASPESPLELPPSTHWSGPPRSGLSFLRSPSISLNLSVSSLSSQLTLLSSLSLSHSQCLCLVRTEEQGRRKNRREMKKETKGLMRGA
jgi:hypothetical protein